MKNLIILLLILNSISFGLHAQTTEIDSLENLLQKNVKEDTTKVNLLTELAYEQDDIDTLFMYAQKAEKLAKELNFIKGEAVSYHLIGIYYQFTDNLPKAIEFFEKSKELSEKNNNQEVLCNALLSIAIIYLYQSNYQVSLDYHLQSLKIAEKNNYEDVISGCYNNIGMIYQEQKEYTKAREFYKKSLKIDQQNQDSSSIATTFNNIGTVYFAEGNYEQALIYFKKAYEINEKTKDQFEIYVKLCNIGAGYYKQGKYTEALEFLEKSLKYGNKQINSKIYYYIGAVKLAQKKYAEALENTLKSLEIAKEMELMLDQQDAYEQLSIIYEKTNNYKKAYKSYQQFKILSDSIFNEEDVKKIAGLEYQYEFDKEKQTIKLEQEKKDIVSAKEAKLQKVLRNSFIAGFLLMIILSVVIFRNFLQKKKANKLLAKQKEKVLVQAEELQTANEKLIELDNFKEEMTGMIVHDLKNPLNTVVNLAENTMVKQSGNQMLNMVMNILDVHKYKNSKMIADISNCSLYEISVNAINDIYFLAKRKNITIENKIYTQTGIYADKEITKRVFVNILTNAIKYTPNNGKISLSNQNLVGFTQIKISDTGQGIPQDKLNTVFDKFVQVSAKKSGNIRSTGLGLTFCKMAVETQKGKIFAESELEKGTTFIFTLPEGKKIKPPEKIKAQIKNDIFTLTTEDKAILKPYIMKLKNILIYEYTLIQNIVKKIDTNNSDSLKYWKQEINKALYAMNEEKYKKLISDI